MRQMSELENIVQKQRLESNKFEKFFFDSKKNLFNFPWLSTRSKRVPLLIHGTSFHWFWNLRRCQEVFNGSECSGWGALQSL
jgi:hypothetical protein